MHFNIIILWLFIPKSLQFTKWSLQHTFKCVKRKYRIVFRKLRFLTLFRNALKNHRIAQSLNNCAWAAPSLPFTYRWQERNLVTVFNSLCSSVWTGVWLGDSSNLGTRALRVLFWRKEHGRTWASSLFPRVAVFWNCFYVSCKHLPMSCRYLHI